MPAVAGDGYQESNQREEEPNGSGLSDSDEEVEGKEEQRSRPKRKVRSPQYVLEESSEEEDVVIENKRKKGTKDSGHVSEEYNSERFSSDSGISPWESEESESDSDPIFHKKSKESTKKVQGSCFCNLTQSRRRKTVRVMERASQELRKQRKT